MESKKLVLIGEDDASYLRIFRLKLSSAGYEVVTANNGEQVMQLAREKQPFLILLDLIMPGKTGFEVLADVKQDPALSSIPVIVLSNLGQEEDKKKALELGAHEYLVKTDITIQQVVDLVKQFK